MAEQEVTQAELLKELEQSNVTVTGDTAKQMKDDIENDRGGSNYLGVGVHEVFITKIELIRAKTGTLGMRFSVDNENGINDATFWLSEAALPYTIKNVSALVVHNAPEKDKGTARTFMSNVVSAKELFDVAQKKLVGGTAYLVIKESKTETYTNVNTGEIKPSLDKNLQTWKPKVDAIQAAKQAVGGEEINVKASDIPF